jgi:hypothetical protein
VIKRVGEVSYEMELPKGDTIHNTFHVCFLKNALGQQLTASTDIPPLDEEGQLVLSPKRIANIREKRLISRFIRDYLSVWR